MPQTKEKQKERRKQAAIAAGREYVEHKPTGIEAKDPTEWRREYKRMQRRKQGAAIRAELTAKAQAEREAKAMEKVLKKAIAALHDAHVKKYKQAIKDREKYAKRYAANPQAEIKRAQRAKQALVDSYVVQQLKAMRIPVGAITPSLIAKKREAMQYRRLGKSVVSNLKSYYQETHETIR